jgi:hypothetical protein
VDVDGADVDVGFFDDAIVSVIVFFNFSLSIRVVKCRQRVSEFSIECSLTPSRIRRRGELQVVNV